MALMFAETWQVSQDRMTGVSQAHISQNMSQEKTPSLSIAMLRLTHIVGLVRPQAKIILGLAARHFQVTWYLSVNFPNIDINLSSSSSLFSVPC